MAIWLQTVCKIFLGDLWGTLSNSGDHGKMGNQTKAKCEYWGELYVINIVILSFSLVSCVLKCFNSFPVGFCPDDQSQQFGHIQPQSMQWHSGKKTESQLL